MRAIISVAIIVAAALSSSASAGEGTLSKDEIRKVVVEHIGEIRRCYNQGLERDPELAGRIVVGFEITGTGAVGRSEISESTLKDAAVGVCVAGAIKTWQFPAPKGGSVAVEYPFVLEPG
jgi:glutamine cyclotransferase